MPAPTRPLVACIPLIAATLLAHAQAETGDASGPALQLPPESTRPMVSPPPATWDDARPKSIVLILCDGMGPSMVATVAELTASTRGPLQIEAMPVVGLVRTASASGIVTDSAASATAYASGVRVPNSTLNWHPDGSIYQTLTELAEEQGKATGLLTTTNLTDASPAAFIARAPSRGRHAEIYQQMVASSVDLLVGGLTVAAAQTGGAPPGDAGGVPSIFSPMLRTQADESGRVILSDASELPPNTGETTRVLIAFPQREKHADAFGPSMADTLEAALTMLGTDPQGFFIVAEVEETDSAGHANDLQRTVDGLIEGDDTLRVALAYQQANPDTLVILTADHDTGGMVLDNEGQYRRPDAAVMWISGNHTANRVPVFAAGPGAHHFTGTMQNTELHDRIAELLAQ